MTNQIKCANWRLSNHSMMASRSRNLGVSLVELMVGLVVALLATLVMAQVLHFAEGYKRTTTAGTDAQVDGALALYTVARDLESAGFGLVNGNLAAAGCQVRAKRGAAAAFTWTLAPMIITDGASGAPDQILVQRSTKPAGMAALIMVNHSQADTTFVLKSALGVNKGDVMVAVPALIDGANWCSVFNASAAGVNGQVPHAGVGTVDGPWNQSGADVVFPAGGYALGGYVLNIGDWFSRSYSVAANALQSQDFSTATGAASAAVDLFPHVVNLQAMYGKDTDADGRVDVYDNVTPTTNAGWRQVIAVRIAVVVRSTQFERGSPVTAVQPLWDVGALPTVTGAADCGASKCLTLKVDHLTDWQQYRYKIYDTVVPLRNMLWGA